MPIPAGSNFAAIPAIQPNVTGTTPTPTPVSQAIRSINGNVVAYGAVLEVANTSGSPVAVTIIDPGRTPAGNPADQTPEQVATGTTEYFRLTDKQVDRHTNVVLVAFQPTDNVSAQVIY
jgi:hypothetical protein